MPQGSTVALGLELVMLWSVWAVVLSINQTHLIRLLDPAPAGVWLRTLAALLMALLGICGGVSLSLGSGGGMLWNLVANLLGLMIALLNAWSVTFASEVVQSVELDARAHPFESAGVTSTATPESLRLAAQAEGMRNSRNEHLPGAQPATTTLSAGEVECATRDASGMSRLGRGRREGSAAPSG